MDGSGAGMGELGDLAAAAFVGRFAEVLPVGALELRLQAPTADACIPQLEGSGLFRARGFPLRSPDEGSSSAFETLLPGGHVRLGVAVACSSCSLDSTLWASFFWVVGAIMCSVNLDCRSKACSVGGPRTEA